MTSAPATRPAALRILVGGFAVVYLVAMAPEFWRTFALESRRWEPVGPLAWLGEPPPATVTRALLLAAIATGAAFTAGWRYRATAPAFALLLLAVTTARNSWGQVWHTENLLVLHVVILALAPAAAAWSVDARRRTGPPPDPAERFAWAAFLMSIATVTTYVLAGVTKLREGGVDWVLGDTLRNQVAYDNVRKAALGAGTSPFAGAVLPHGWLFVPMAIATLAVELGAPLALTGRRAARWWAAAAWSFHAGVLALMAIGFPYPLSGVAFASLFPLDRVGIALSRQRRLARWTRSPRSSAPAPTTTTSG